MKHNYEGLADLDHIIMAMLRGMERALLEYSKLSAGLKITIHSGETGDANDMWEDLSFVSPLGLDMEYVRSMKKTPKGTFQKTSGP